jgi:FtsZ-binding cell division protein ZapB
MKTVINFLSSLTVLIFIFFAACSPDTDQRLINDQDNSLRKKDSLIRDYASTLVEIDAQLDAIRDAHGLIILGPESNVDERVSTREQILRNIAMINEVMKTNHRKLKEMELVLTAAGERDETLNALTHLYAEKIKLAQAEVAELKEQITQAELINDELRKSSDTLRLKNEQLNRSNLALTERVKEMDREMHSGWFASGTRRELMKENVITRKGSLLKGRATIISPEANMEKFVRVNTREAMMLGLNATKAEMITTHPSKSYVFLKAPDGTLQLHITHPDLFWSVSKYLVIETNV